MNMEATLTAVEAHALVERDAKSKSRQEIRDVRESLTVGRAVRQGDVYLVRLDDIAETVAKRGTPMKTRQLVDGTTQGSRHVAEGELSLFESDPAIRLPSCVRNGALLGPVIVAASDFVVTHPEHAHVRCAPGAYQVVHQLDAATRQRVQD
jgi:hypothetical protein